MGDILSSPTENPMESICHVCYDEKIEPKMKKVKIYLCRGCYEKRKRQYYSKDLVTEQKPEIDQITENIFIGNIAAATSKELLKEHNITQIMVCGYYLNTFFPQDFRYKTIEIDDSENEDILSHLVECFEFIDSGSKVFIHCRSGISRSSSIIIAYLMYKNRLSFSEAKSLLLLKRNKINPNNGFTLQLQSLEKILYASDYRIQQIPSILHEIQAA